MERTMLDGKTTVLMLLAVLSGTACASSAAEKSTGSNWLICETDADCAAVPGATCGADNYCVDATGSRVGAFGYTGGGGSGGVGGSTGPLSTIIVDCYSPGQQLEGAYEQGAIGCKCPEGAPELCVLGVSLRCDAGRWQAMEGGACARCWTPDHPYAVSADPGNGCACETEGDAACSLVEPTGYHFTCSGGKWVLEEEEATPCTCTSDAQCWFGTRCVDGGCVPGVCEVDGMRYSNGFSGIPDPLGCGTCQCRNGVLDCETVACPEEPTCPDGMSPVNACVFCSTEDGCHLGRSGCQATCSSDVDCALTYTPVCHPEHRVCVGGVCE
jgi:hypothetical protein